VHTEIVDEPQKAPEPNPKWGERLHALRHHTPLIFRMVWESAPKVVVASLGARLLASLIPLAMLAVTGTIIQNIHAFTSHEKALTTYFWWLVAAEFALASLSTILVRVLDFFDTVLADKFTRHISTRIVLHASRLDLTSYEDPVFYDKMDGTRPRSGHRSPDHDPIRRPPVSARHNSG
jgi:ATP-binding cassette subfamily B protein